uniref:Gypsy retrotransposon integrase-like protein 1 n=1 Tax=Astyanax mexicanus TaxID=7994 RepID=A0A3B1KK37_ASTMX
MDEKKVDAVTGWKKPVSRKDLQRFLGFANFYRRFIRNFSLVAAPLTTMLRGGHKKLVWNLAAEQAFDKLKTLFTSAPMLKHPDPSLPFIVEVDASDSGVGAVLSQRQGNPAKLFPCAYFFLSPTECNYDVGNRELLAIKLALEEWRHWLEGAHHPFIVLTDHRNLEYLRTAKRLNSRQARWALFFSRFCFTITYRPGSKNGKADALSRLFEKEKTQSDPQTILNPSCILAPIQWDIEEDIRQASRSEPTPHNCPANRVFVPESCRDRLIRWAHTSLATGHPGTARTYHLLGERYWWPRMEPEIHAFIQSCSLCARIKSPRSLPAGKLEPLPIPLRPWSHLSIDFLTDLPPSQTFTTILVVIDRFSKACKLVPFTTIPTAFQTAEALFTHVFRNFGIPEDIVSDRGPQFTSSVWKAFMDKLGITVSLTSGHHPEANGQVERLNQEIGRLLRHYCHDQQGEWSHFLPWAEYSQNSLRSSSTGLTPFQCVLGYQPPLFPWNAERTDAPAVDDWFTHSERAWEQTHARLGLAVRRQKAQADRHRGETPLFNPGDRVWLSTRDLKLRLPCCKLSPQFVGPFRILQRINNVTYKLLLPRNYRVSPSFHVSLLRPVIPGPLDDASPLSSPPPALDIDGSPAYKVNTIVDSRRRRGHIQYLVDWEGYGPEERSWVSTSDILDPSLITDFHSRRPERPAPRPRGRPPGRTLGAPGVARREKGSVTPVALHL